ncbi:MAG: hypothetical protein AAF630_16530 [Cyanobacteria bacterium P01_C01_bin.38]
MSKNICSGGILLPYYFSNAIIRNYQLSMPHAPSPIPNYQLPTTNYQLPVCKL